VLVKDFVAVGARVIVIVLVFMGVSDCDTLSDSVAV
jgi:hypothetical protein